MISEKLTLTENPKDMNKSLSISPHIKYKTKYFNLFKTNMNQNNNNDNNLTKSSPNGEKEKDSFNKSIKISNNNNPLDHPLVFYALGKVNKSKIDNKTLPLYTSQGFHSYSNDLIRRNILSLNTLNNTFFDNIKKTNENSSVKHKILEENDYLNPIKIYKSFHKYIPNKNCFNQETYNLAKKKIYSRDIFSNIKKGVNITKKEFIEQKKNLMDDKIKSVELKIKKPNIKIKHSFDDTKYDNDKKYNTIHTDNNNKYIFKDPIDHTKEELKSKEWRFDRNYKNFIKHKNWWKRDKYVIIYNYFNIF